MQVFPTRFTASLKPARWLAWDYLLSWSISPDISGRVNAAGASAWQEPGGCFYFPDPGKTAYMAEYSATKQSPTGLGFKASNENAIYRGATLQTNALRLIAIIKSWHRRLLWPNRWFKQQLWAVRCVFTQQSSPRSRYCNNIRSKRDNCRIELQGI